MIDLTLGLSLGFRKIRALSGTVIFKSRRCLPGLVKELELVDFYVFSRNSLPFCCIGLGFNLGLCGGACGIPQFNRKITAQRNCRPLTLGETVSSKVFCLNPSSNGAYARHSLASDREARS